MAYSSGFHPHPRISYAGASPTGAASEAEYLELGLAERRDPEEVRRALDDALPDGLDVAAIAESPGGSLADLLVASAWLVELRGADPEPRSRRRSRPSSAPRRCPVERMTKKGLRTFDCRAAVVSLAVTEADGEPALDARAAPHRARRTARRRALRPRRGHRIHRPRDRLADPDRAGAAGRDHGRGRRPARLTSRAGIPPVHRLCAILATDRPPTAHLQRGTRRTDSTTFSPVP